MQIPQSTNKRITRWKKIKRKQESKAYKYIGQFPWIKHERENVQSPWDCPQSVSIYMNRFGM